ncbi:putative ATPase (AAA+ superfamily) [Enhygromyxa salina]|uniref:Putative ATPase (AAA+ superfamily) n=2 Tax=Enhygromyxa salina TaxID=215803 RepID=A0A0C2A6R8_9BACT|nr:putative ATPase (AAA+ superfamily) [Enhygromyxa salina]
MKKCGHPVDHYLCTPTGHELPEMLTHWQHLETLLDKLLTQLEADVSAHECDLTIRSSSRDTWPADMAELGSTFQARHTRWSSNRSTSSCDSSPSPDLTTSGPIWATSSPSNPTPRCAIVPHPMSLLPFSNTLEIRDEVLDPRGLLDMVDLAALDLKSRGLVGKGAGSEVMRDPAAFFSITYPTAEIVGTLRTLSQRWTSPESVPGTILLAGKYGLGKSHVLLAAHHALTAPNVVSEWAQRWNLEPIELPPDPIVLTRSFIQRSKEPLWKMLLVGLGQDPQSVTDFLDGESIEAVLGDRPVFLIMDEVERWYDSQAARAQSRNRNFLQALTEVSMRTPRLTFLTSVLGEKPEPAETIRRVRPLELSFRSAEDRQRVVLFRLFKNRDSEQAKQVAAEVTDQYMACYTKAGLEDLDSLRARMIECWPFAPEFLDILSKKIPNVGGFQNTRGTLRFLAHVVRHTHESRPLVSSQDLPLRDQTIVQALSNLAGADEVVRRALGDNYDVVPDNLAHKDELFSALLFYSVADPTRPGATLEELLLATLDPGENPIQIRDSLAQLKLRAFNLHERDHRYVFLAIENPHARVTAMASSDRVTPDAVNESILDALSSAWGLAEQTAILKPMNEDALRGELRGLRRQRPRIVLSTVALSSKDRLRIQNLEDQRNLVLIVEPSVRTDTNAENYSLFSDEDLLHRARRVVACKLLLEGRPASESAVVYRKVLDDDSNRLRRLVTERYGTTTIWEKAGATDSQVDSSWYELHALESFSGAAFLEMVARDLTGKPDIVHEIRKRWESYRQRSVAALSDAFDSTPGLPIPLDASWVPQAARQLVGEGVLSLVGADGSTLPRRAVEKLSDEQVRECTITDPQGIEPEPGKEELLLVHTHVQASYDGSTHAVMLSWSYPEDRSGAADFRTVVQRYTTVRNWVCGEHHPIDTDDTYEANRHYSAELDAQDSTGLQPGQTYYYYVFLIYEGLNGQRSVLSQRCDVSIPQAKKAERADIIETGTQSSKNRLVIEIEKKLMSGEHMRSEHRVRKIEVIVRAVSGPELGEKLAEKLHLKVGDALSLAADLTFSVRGEYNRQEVLAVLRALPDFAGANYTASLYLRQDTSGN